MEKRVGTVVEVGRGIALVELARAQPCAGCAFHSSCGHLELFPSANQLLAEADNSCGARAGEQVAVGLEPGALLAIAALVYLLPALSAVLGAVLGSSLGPSLVGCNADVGAMAGLAVFAAASLALIRAIHPRLSNRPPLRLSATRVVDLPDPAETGAGNARSGERA